MTFALLLAGCRDAAPAPETNIVAEEGLPPIPDIVRAKGCADRWRVTLNARSFADRDGRPVPAERLKAFEESVVPAVRGAANEACAAGEVDVAEAAAIRTLVIVNDDDRDTPKFYVDDEEDRTRTFLNDAFVSRNFEIPSEMELRQGMQCLTSIAAQPCQESIQ